MRHLKEALTMLANIQSVNFRKIIASINEDADFVVDYLLQDFSIHPLVIGGLAVQRYGHRRLTEDIDLLISAQDFGTLSDAGRIQGRNLLIRPDLIVEVIVAGEMNTPDLEEIRDGQSVYPTLEGLIYLKMLSGRPNDLQDIIALLAIHLEDQNLINKVKELIPKDMFEDFLQFRELAKIQIQNKLPPTPQIKSKS